MFGRQILVRRVVLEISVQQLAEQTAFDQLADHVEQRVVALHQIRNEQPILLPRDRDQLVRLFDRKRQRLLADDMLARVERLLRLIEMQERRRRDVDEIDVRRRERADRLSTTSSSPYRWAAAIAAGRAVPAIPASRIPGTCTNCCSANRPKPPQPITPKPMSASIGPHFCEYRARWEHYRRFDAIWAGTEWWTLHFLRRR